MLLFSALMAGCGDFNVPYSVDFTHTGCLSTKGEQPRDLLNDDLVSELVLQYTEAGLAVTRTNARLNCIIKNDGYSCNVSVNGKVIRYEVSHGPYEADCTCLVERMSSTVKGLEEGKEYVLEYSCDGIPVTVEFKYTQNLKRRINVDKYFN